VAYGGRPLAVVRGRLLRSGLTIVAAILQRPVVEEILTLQGLNSQSTAQAPSALCCSPSCADCSRAAATNSTAPWLYLSASSSVVATVTRSVTAVARSLLAAAVLSNVGAVPALHAVNWTVPSDYVLTRDAASGLDWLDFSQTLGYGGAGCAGTAKRRRHAHRDR
jgi:hypothetical protein